MYTAYFDFKENPFNLTPDQRYLFLSRHHKEAFDHLLYGISERKGFIVITGDIGTGKTTLCRALLNQLDVFTKSALIFNTSISDIELLETINCEFGIEEGRTKETKKEHIDRLNNFLLDNFRQGGNAVLVIDEAQNLSPSVLEQIRMLSNLETEKEKLIQIILVGQPELGELLTSSALRQLKERITVWYQLKPLDRKDVQSYVEHRLVVAGGRGDLKFTRGAFSAIYAYSHGNPRRINAVCDRALLIAYCKDKFAINRNTVLKAMGDIQGEFRPGHTKAGRLKRRVAPAVVVVLLVFIAASLGGWNFRKPLSYLFSDIQKIPVPHSKPIVRKPIRFDKAPVIQDKPSVQEGVESQKKAASLTLDYRASLGGLFSLFNVEDTESGLTMGEVYPGLFSFKADPELYRMFRKPFRLRVKSESGNQPRYLLIQQVTAGGAIALDAEGKERPVTEDFILAHLDREMSWVYPYEHENTKLTEGMSGPGVLKVQQILWEMGYSVEPRGVYDNTTSNEVMRFQRDFALKADGIVDTQTKALLYQMSD